MTRITLQSKKNISDEIRKRLRRLPLTFKGRLREAIDLIIQRLQRPGKKPTYPIQWDSDKQRRAFFATNGFGGGIPHQRTGKLAGGWKRESLDNGFVLVNRFKGAKYVWGNVRGEYQSQIHVGRWPLLRDILNNVIARLPKIIQESLRTLRGSQ